MKRTMKAAACGAAALCATWSILAAGPASGAGSPTTVQVTTFEASTTGCAGPYLLPLLQQLGTDPLPALAQPLCGVPSGNASETANATPDGDASATAFAAGGSQILGESASADGLLNANVPVTTPVTSLDVSMDYETDLAQSVHAAGDGSFAGAVIMVDGPACTSGSGSTFVDPLTLNAPASGQTGTFTAHISCADGSQIAPGTLHLNAIVEGLADSSHGSTEQASGHLRLTNASITFNP